jgi:hypothetical protein
MAIGLQSYQDGVRKDDVLDLITNVDYKNTPLYSGLGTTTAFNTYHEWPEDTFDAAAHNAVIEGADATVVDHTTATRKGNITQIFRKVLQVTDTERAIDIYGMKDPYAYQQMKAMVAFARDVENALVAGTTASGSSGVARKLSGAIQQISTNKTARNSGTSLTEVEFNDIFQGIYDSGTEDVANEVYVNSYLKRAISRLTGGATKQVDASDKRLWNSVSVYEGDFGTVRVYLSRVMPNAAAACALLAIRPEYLKVAYLNGRKPKHTPLAKTGSATKGMIEGELTLEVRGEKTCAYRSGYVRS